MVLSPSSEFFRYFRDPDGKEGPAKQTPPAPAAPATAPAAPTTQPSTGQQ
jgi:membrane protease subunit HflC